MNKLEEYRDNLFREEGGRFCEGFDAAIALDLPIKFVNWIHNAGYHELTYGTYVREHLKANNRTPLFKESYQYWSDNVFKIE